jgi:hypothetical protein
VFADNVVVARRPQSAPFPCGQHCTHNLFAGMPPSGEAAVVGDPRFVDGRRRAPSGFRLRAGSPAIGAAAPIADAGTRDYFGDPVGPTIGFATGPPA